MDNNQVAPADHVEDKPKMVPEPFGYFRCTLDGWIDCAETDEGARPLYEYSAIEKRDAEIERLRKSLLAAGFTDCGGELWKPQLGQSASPLLDELTTLRAQLQEAEGKAQMFDWLRDQYHGFAYLRNSGVPGVSLESEIRKALATYQSTQGQNK